MGGSLVSKLVNPTKVFCSWTPHQSGRGEILTAQTKPHIRTGAARILRKPYAAVGQELSGLDPANRVVDQLAELLALLFGDSGAEVLDFREPLTDEHDLCDLGDTRHPGVADQLRIES